MQANNDELATLRRQAVLLLSVPVFFLKKRHTMREGDPASSKPSGMASAFSCAWAQRGGLLSTLTVFFFLPLQLGAETPTFLVIPPLGAETPTLWQ